MIVVTHSDREKGSGKGALKRNRARTITSRQLTRNVRGKAIERGQYPFRILAKEEGIKEAPKQKDTRTVCGTEKKFGPTSAKTQAQTWVSRRKKRWAEGEKHGPAQR